MKIVELQINEEDTLGMEAVALVSEPAIEADFFAFKNVDLEDLIVTEIIKQELLTTENFVDRLPGESKDDYLGRCIPKLINEGYEQDQATAICYESLKKENFEDEFKYFDDLPEDRQDAILNELERVGISEDSLLEQGYAIAPNSSHGKITLGVSKKDAQPDLPTNETNGNFKILYRYNGPLDDKNRKFCRRLLKLDLLFRKEDIDRLTIKGANEEFGYYDIFQYKGSYNCRHHWNKVYVYQKKEGQIKSTLKKETFSIDEDQRVVVGPLMIPDKLILRIDEEGNPYYVYFSKETVRTIAEKLMRNELLNNMNLEHDSNRPVQGTMLETWIIEDSEKDKSALYNFNLPIGTWMGMYRIHDNEVWKMVKEGVVKGFSIEGFFADRNVQT